MNKVSHVQQLLNSFKNLTGKNLIQRSSPELDYKKVEHGEFVVVSHNGAEDPVLNYGNQFALSLWEMDWHTFIRTPSRKTAEPDLREKRQEMLKKAKEKGFFEGYEGIRISSKGKRFRIKDAIIWTVFNEDGEKIGQAAYFDQIEYLS
ncbi:MAG: MEKHLA domain-containing protein [Flavobacteriales bacterium]|nr:MEKHLA domain-containing protein [Flavobacteriales bacterium]|tara:strand:+ start:882 stop:1325 length:444 start_codon:yes stop_codon:yes gene_type:complete